MPVNRDARDPVHVHVAIIGTGFGGLGAAIRLQQEGFRDFVLLERANDIGGTWRDNSYPGCACDVQSHLYSFSFAPNPDWSQSYSPQAEILAYLRHCAERFGILPHVRYGHDVRAIAWDEGAQRWRIDTTRGEFSASVLISGVGAFSEPAIPPLSGLETFQGKAFHSARWDHDHDLSGRRVAVIGTGASAIQFIPAIQPTVGQMHVFQRTAAWVLPRRNGRIGGLEHLAFRAFPALQRLVRGGIYGFREIFVLAFRHPELTPWLERLALRYLEESVADPVLRAKLTPSFRIGCKRILISSQYLPSLTQGNVEVVTERIREVRPRSIVTADGKEREVDTIVLGTGFHVTDMPFYERVRGRDGRTLKDTWRGSPKAHLGTTVAGFPNLFLLLGPNTGLGHTSIVCMIESQIEHVVSALHYMRSHDVAAVEPRPEAQARFVEDVDRRLRGTVWTSGNCASYYLDVTGRASALWPDSTWRFRRRVKRFDPSEYALERPAPLRSLTPHAAGPPWPSAYG